MFAIPIHPALVHFPLAMLTASWFCLLAWHWTGQARWDERSRLSETVGVATVPLVILAGIADADGLSFVMSPRWDLPLIWHFLVSIAASATFAAHWFWRRRLPEAVQPGRTTVLIDVSTATAGMWLLVLTGMIAGEMVYGA